MFYSTSQVIHQKEMRAQQQLHSNAHYVMLRNMRIWSNPINVIRISIFWILYQNIQLLTILVQLNMANLTILYFNATWLFLACDAITLFCN